MPRVLIVGQGGVFNLEHFVSRAFLQLGWEVLRLNSYAAIPNPVRFNTYLRMLSSRSYKFHSLIDHVAGMEEKMTFHVERMRPDLLLVFKGELFPPKVARKVSYEHGVKTAIWFPDDPRFLGSILLPIAQSFDHVVVSSRSTIPLLEDIGVRSATHLPFACDPGLHKSMGLKKRYDLTFVGSYYPERARVLVKIANHELRVWGPGWNMPWVPKKVRRQVMQGGSFGQESVEILNKSRITVNVHNQFDLRASGKANMRVFEATGCGAFLLTDETDGIRESFRIGQELVCYESSDDLPELVEQYLNSKDERERIASAGQQRAYRDHTYSERVRVLLTKMSFASVPDQHVRVASTF
jgi:spore maturation protein CgeB